MIKLQQGKMVDSLGTDTALGGSGTWDALWYDVSLYEGIIFSCNADVAGTLYAEFSNSGTEDAGASVPSQISYAVAAGVNEVHRLLRTRRFFRLRYVNGSAAQSSFNVSAFVGASGILTSSHSSNVQQDTDAVVVRSIPPDIELASGKFTGHTIVNKFGMNNSVSTSLTGIWYAGGIMAWPTSAESLEVISASTDDASAGTGAQQVTIYGLDANWAEQSATVTMNGTTAVPVSGTWLRVSRMRVSRRGGYTTSNAGVITLRVASGGATRLQIGTDATFGGYGTTLFAGYTIPAGKTGYMKSVTLNVESSKPVNIYGVVRTDANDVTTSFSGERYPPLVFRGIQGYEARILANPLVLAAYTDIFFQAYATGATTGFVSVTFQIILVDN